MKSLTEYLSYSECDQAQQKLRRYYESNTRIQEEIEKGIILPGIVDIDSHRFLSDSDFFTAVSEYFENLSTVETNKLRERLEKELNAVNDMAIYQPPLVTTTESVSSGIYLYKGKKIDLMIFSIDKFKLKKAKQENGIKGITIQANDIGFLCLKGSGEITTYSLNQKFTDNDGVPDNLTGRCKIDNYKSGTIFFLKRGLHGLTFSKCSKSSTFIAITRKDIHMLTKPQYSVDTFELLGSVHAESLASRIQMASVTLRMLGKNDFIPIMEPFLAHKNLFIRWQAAREIFLTDPKSAFEIFQKLTKDESKVIREAAQICLKEYYGEKNAISN